MNSSYKAMKLFQKLGMLVMIISPLSAISQNYIKPLKGEISLSGNFTELRSTHLHAGLDFRTGGREGLPVYAIEAGFVARVNISPVGYGNALYIQHYNGQTSVYGHLQRFSPKIEKIIKKLQYETQSFRIDKDFRPYNISFKKGEIIAYSGNSGSSNGPHLHFEIRDTDTEWIINPLHYYKILDTKAPKPLKTYIYSLDMGCTKNIEEYPVSSTQANTYTTQNINIAEGWIGLGFTINDYMNTSPYKQGVYKIRVDVNGENIFSLKMDSISFGQSKYINDIKDFMTHKRRETTYRCFGYYQNHINGIKNSNNGHIYINKDKIYKIIVTMEDINGNKSLLNITAKGVTAKPLYKNSDTFLSYDKANQVSFEHGFMYLDAWSLPSNIRRYITIDTTNSSFNYPIINLAEEETPLLREGLLSIKGQYPQKSVICELTKSGRLHPIPTKWDKDSIIGIIKYLNRYVIIEDSIAPTIKPLPIKNNSLFFRIDDNLGNIKSFNAYINNTWVLFSYDKKNKLITSSLKELPYQNNHDKELRIELIDLVGNKTVFTSTLNQLFTNE